MTLAATDDSQATGGVVYTEYRVDGGAWLEYTAPVALDPAVLGQGSHSLEYRATDASGNVSAVGKVDVKFDTAVPVVSATTSPASPSGWWKSAATVTVNATDASTVDGGSVRTEYRVDGGAWTVYAAPVVLDPAVLGDGAHSLEYRATDAAGNVSAVGKVDVKFDDRSGGHHAGDRGQASGTPGPSSCPRRPRTPCPGWPRCSSRWTARRPAGRAQLWTLSLGRHTLQVTAVDKAGNTTTTTVAFTVTTSLADMDGLVQASRPTGASAPPTRGSSTRGSTQASSAQARDEGEAAPAGRPRQVRRRRAARGDDEVAAVLLRDSSAVTLAVRRG